MKEAVWGWQDKQSTLLHQEQQVHSQYWLHSTERLPDVSGDSQEQSPPTCNESFES